MSETSSLSIEKQQKLLSVIKAGFDIQRGSPLPLGSSIRRGGINFAVFSRHAIGVTLVLFTPGDYESLLEFPLDPRYHKTGDVWHAFITGIDPGIRYGYRAFGPLEGGHLHRFDPNIVLLDPYAKAFSGAPRWGKLHQRTGQKDADRINNSRRSLVVDDAFDWGHDRPLTIPLSDSVIYEIHVRGFTRHFNSGVQHPGTFKGLIEKIPYLKKLGVTAVELLPINEFEELEENLVRSTTGNRLVNFWGYNSIGFFAPKASYAVDNVNDGPVKEFKAMVKAMHEAGIEVILDIVFNHTAEGNEQGPTYSFKGLDNSVYYILDPRSGKYHNYSGCGNTLNCNHPVVRDMILDCLRYWVTEMHVDGFRFDLASILGRGQDGSVLSNPPLIERIAYDPVLAKTKLIAEAWDAAGLYQVGTFPSWGRWAEWNSRFRDDIRKFLRGDPGMAGALATRLTGSSDLYQGSGRAPFHSINFVTSHDGFTLHDLVSYNQKHNLANGEGNRDGAGENFSWNGGEEGPSGDPEILALRRQQMKNFAALLLLSHGVPMILGGDEFGRTQRGNNNAYCQDNEISWVDWKQREAYSDLERFFRLMIAFRKAHSNLRRTTFSNGDSPDLPRIRWHGARLNQPDWSHHSHALAMQLDNNPDDQDIFIIMNAYWEALRFELPPPDPGTAWHRVVDTSLEAPDDICEEGEEMLVGSGRYPAGPRSVVVLLAK